MPTYFFHVIANGEFHADREGLELEGPGEAHAHARRLIARLMASPRAFDWRSWRVRVAEADGGPAFTVLFPRQGDGVERAAVAGFPAQRNRRLA